MSLTVKKLFSTSFKLGHESGLDLNLNLGCDLTPALS